MKCGCIWLIIVAIVVAVLMVPFLMIWCINTLWDMDNPYNFAHWFAALCVGGGLFGGSLLGGKKE